MMGGGARYDGGRELYMMEGVYLDGRLTNSLVSYRCWWRCRRVEPGDRSTVGVGKLNAAVSSGTQGGVG